MRGPWIQSCVSLLVITALGTADLSGGPPRRPRLMSGSGIVWNIDGNGHKNNEIEGAIWEYKIVHRVNAKSTSDAAEAVSRGKLRIKGNAIYSVGTEPTVAEREHRVGDVAVVNNGSTLQLRFDDHPDLTGRAVLRPSRSRQDAGRYTGYFLAANK